uniref:VWFA domain-containing protein n=2 Tax=Oryza TaxID=4527 RepID=A0A0E0FBP4_9ORYZ
MTIFNDDELTAPSNSGSTTTRPTAVEVSEAGKVKLAVYKNDEAPLEENTQQALLELTGADSTVNRPGLDLVAVLDVSGSMKEHGKLEKMKTALLFVVKKLSDVDRLSIVTFSDGPDKVCPLRFVTESSMDGFKVLVDGLSAHGWTNIRGGLEMGIQVVAGRRLSAGRVAAMMLMSDGVQNRGGDAREVNLGSLPVYTFGFGADHDPTVLNAIATKSVGGVFNFVKDQVSLSKNFSQPLAGLLTVVVQELQLTVTPIPGNSTIVKVDPGSYPQIQNIAAGSFTITFGNLYGREVRKVLVDLVLPAVKEDGIDCDILEAKYTYISSQGKPFDSPSEIYSIQRTGDADPDAQNPEVQSEVARRQHAGYIKEARTMADANDLRNAMYKLAEAQNKLEDIVLDKAKPMVDMLRTELQQLRRLMESPELYKKEGRPYALSAETSHDRQRMASRGDVEDVRLFATPRMDKYLAQAKLFDEDPAAPIPSADEDAKEELAANPLAPLAGPLAFYIKAAIQALQSLEKIISVAATPR